MSDVMLMAVAVAYESETAGPFVAQRLLVIRSNEDFAVQFAKFRGEFETDDYRVAHSIVSKVEVVDGFTIVLAEED